MKHDNGNFIKTVLRFEDDSCIECIINEEIERIDGKFPLPLEVFNVDFINQYIYLGHEVTADHKNNLYKFVFGEHQVQLQKQIDEKIEEIKEINNQIKVKKAELTKITHISIDKIEDFVGMNVQETIQDLEKQISDLRIKLENLRENEYINKLSKLKPIDIKNVEDLVSKVKNACMASLKELHSTTLKRFKEHIQILGEDKRKWLKEGFQTIKSKNLNICPFCGQDIKANELIKEYEMAFNEEYISFIRSLDKLSEQINQFSLSYIIKIVNQNDELIQKWSEYISDLNIPQLGDIHQIEKEIKHELTHLLDQKRQNVFISLDNFSKIDFLLQSIVQQVGSYNVKVGEINRQIEEFKQGLSRESSQELSNKIKMLELKLKRKQLDSLCQEYKKLLSEKDKTEQEKKKLIDQLNEEMNEIMDKYKEQINSIFDKFNTDYRIEPYRVGATRKRQVFEYGIRLNFSEETRSSKQLGEILSEGDKTTLAFSVFIAKLFLDDKLNERLIIIDDPVSSLDEFRIVRTVDYIIRVAHKAKQVVILTHNSVFAKELLYRIKKEQLNANFYHIDRFRYRDRSLVNEMNLSTAEYFIEQKLNHYYVKFINIKDVVDKWNRSKEVSADEIDKAFDDGREVFEHYIRIKFPNDLFTPISEVINKIENENKRIFLRELYNALSKDPHSNTVQLGIQDKISRLIDLVNFIQFDKYN